MSKPHVASLLVFPLFALCACAQTAVVETDSSASPETQAFEASPVFADTLWLDNGTIRLGVSPSVGRITWFGLKDGQSLLWVNRETVNTPPDGDPSAWINYGGDKTWHSPQPLWPYFLEHRQPWPPDGTIDGEAWQVTVNSPTSLSMRSPSSPVFGGYIERIVSLDAAPHEALEGTGFADNKFTACRVRIVNRIHRTGPSALPAQAWSVTQVRPADHVILFDHSEGRVPNGWILLDGDPEKLDGEIDVEDGVIHWIPQDGNENWKKIGTLGSTLIARFGDTAFVQHHAFDPQGSYPEHSSLQLYVADDYQELEMLSPLQTLKPGESLEHTVFWMLMPVAELPDRP